MKRRLAIAVGGGPAPGINGVIEAATTEAISSGVEVLGVVEGFKWLSNGDVSHIRELTLQDVQGIRHRGGSILRTSRDNPTKDAEKMKALLESLKKLNVSYLVTIGGDDTSHSARKIAEQSKGAVSVAHVPKTIDNDLPLPPGVPTFGFETARDLGAQLVHNLLEDAATSSRWYFVVSMGRSAGFLGLGMATAAGAPLAVVSEEFPYKTPLKKLLDIIEGAIIKRLSLGLDYGVAVVSEGVAERIDPEDFSFMNEIGRDEHGNLKLADVPLGQVLKEMVTERLSKRGIKMKIIPKEIGFELRCCPPGAFDRAYTVHLGAGAARFLITQGGSGAMITFTEGKICPVPFEDLIDRETGKTVIRTIDTSSDDFLQAMNLSDRLKKEDFQNRDILEALAEAAGGSTDDFTKDFAYLTD